MSNRQQTNAGPTMGPVMPSKKEQQEQEALYKGLRTPWADLKTEDKVERCRVNVKNLQVLVRNLQASIDALWEHGHDKDGKMVIIISKDKLYQFKQGSNDITKAMEAGGEVMF